MTKGKTIKIFSAIFIQTCRVKAPAHCDAWNWGLAFKSVIWHADGVDMGIELDLAREFHQCNIIQQLF